MYAIKCPQNWNKENMLKISLKSGRLPDLHWGSARGHGRCWIESSQPTGYWALVSVCESDSQKSLKFPET